MAMMLMLKMLTPLLLTLMLEVILMLMTMMNDDDIDGRHDDGYDDIHRRSGCNALHRCQRRRSRKPLI